MPEQDEASLTLGGAGDGGKDSGCLRVGRVYAITRGDWAAVNIEIDAEG